MFITGFEIENPDTPGKYTKPPYESFKLCLGVVKPGEDVEVTIRRRPGYEDVDFAFEM